MIKKFKYDSHEEWLALRHEYIGGSEAGAILGMNPYKSAYTLWAEKTGRIQEFTGNITTKTGAYLEDFVARLFEEESGKKVKRCNAMMVNDRYPFAEANVDRLVMGEKSLLEIKTTNSLPNMKRLRSGEFPDTWYAQCTHYLAVTELEKAYLAVLVNCREFYIFELEREEAEIEALMRAEEDFWNLVKTNTPPAVDGASSTTDTIGTLYPESNDSQISLTAYDGELRQYMELGSRIKALKAEQDEIGNRVKAYMGEAAKGDSGEFKVSWVSSVRKSFDAKAFSSSRPDIDLSPYYKETKTRTFKVTERK